VATSTIPGVDPASIPGLAPNTIQVDITERVQTFFSGLLTGSRTQDVHVRSRCAVLKAAAPVPLLVLNPICPSSLSANGNPTVAIIGGPARSIQVNSSDPTAVDFPGSSQIDLHQGGAGFTGSFLGTYGGPSSLSFPRFDGGSTGGWNYKTTPVSDPYALVPAPALPALSPTNGAPIKVTVYPDTTYGCPDHSGCDVYLPGQYTEKIQVKGSTALFVPGLYYFNITDPSKFAAENCGDPNGCVPKPNGNCNYALSVDSNGVVRTSTAVGDGSKGLTFYLSGGGGSYGSVFFGSNAGKSGGRTVDDYNTTAAGTGVSCPGAPPPDAGLNLPTTVEGNVLLGPCTQDGTYFSSTTNGSMTGPVRGMLFFQDRANSDNHGQPSMQGGGGLVLVGTMYFHHCPNSTTTGCDDVSDYRAFYQLQGGSGTGTFLLRNITTDRLIVSGGAKVSMQLNTAAVFTILKAALIQ
jgi:hypothetical protein